MTDAEKLKLLELALRFIARQQLLGKFDDYLTCNARNNLAEERVQDWLRIRE